MVNDFGTTKVSEVLEKETLEKIDTQMNTIKQNSIL